jgi:hypothetical protein
MTSQSAIPEPTVVVEKPEFIAAVEPLTVSNLHAAFFTTGSSMTVHDDTMNLVTVSVPSRTPWMIIFPTGTLEPEGRPTTELVLAGAMQPSPGSILHGGEVVDRDSERTHIRAFILEGACKRGVVTRLSDNVTIKRCIIDSGHAHVHSEKIYSIHSNVHQFH